MFRLTGWWD